MANGEVLPGYTWDPRSGRYRSNKTGRFVARRDILNLLRAQVDSAEQRLADLTQAFYEGLIAASVWMEMFRTSIRRYNMQNRALGAGGWDQMDNTDWLAVDTTIRDDNSRLPIFATAIVAGELTIAQALARARMYAGTARVQYWEAERRRVKPVDPANVLIMKRSLQPAEHCQSCIDLHEMGYQYSLPSPGDGSTECLSNDRCILEYREVPADEVGEWLGTRRR